MLKNLTNNNWIIGLFLFVVLVMPFVVKADSASVVWATRTDITPEDFTFSPGHHSFAIDGNGNEYVAGYTREDDNYDFLTVKYDNNGNQVWTGRYDNGGHDTARAIALDDLGNVYVTGESNNGMNLDYAVVKYDMDGNRLWVARFDGATGDDYPSVILTDTLGSVYVTGYSRNGRNFDSVTVKYDSSGNVIWTQRYDNGAYDCANDMAIDSSGNIYITGSSYNVDDSDFFTIKYDGDGNQDWANRYDGGNDDGAQYLAINPSGDAVYVVGFGSNGGNSDIVIVKYDQNGSESWVSRYDSGDFDGPNGIAVDVSGDVFVSGTCWRRTADIVTIKFGSGGNQEWAKMIDYGFHESSQDLALDDQGNVYIAGLSARLGYFVDGDYLVVKYDTNGNQAFVERYDSGGGDVARSIAIDNSGSIFISGVSSLPPENVPGRNYDFLVLKYAKNYDVTPPSTSIVLSGAAGINNWYVSDVEIILSAFDNDGGSGIEKMEYSFDQQNWLVYNQPFAISDEGIHELYYRSIDKAENVEGMKSAEIKIDKSVPQIQISAGPNILWPPNYKMVNVAVNGSVSDPVSGVASTAFQVFDEYSRVQPVLSNFGDIISLESWRDGNDQDGRRYTIIVTATDEAGNQATATTGVVCPHDQRK